MLGSIAIAFVCVKVVSYKMYEVEVSRKTKVTRNVGEVEASLNWDF